MVGTIPWFPSAGLLPPQKLPFGVDGWYTDAIWTATHATTSLGYCRQGKMMFACAVLDENIRKHSGTLSPVRSLWVCG